MGWILLFIVLSSPTGRVHWWFSGRILASHAGEPGSIPGQCSVTFSSPFWPINQGVFLAPAKVFVGCDSSQPSMQKDLCFFLNTGKLRKLKDPWFTLFFSSKSLKCMASLTFSQCAVTKYSGGCIGGSMVEFSPPTRETRVRFLANAT